MISIDLTRSVIAASAISRSRSRLQFAFLAASFDRTRSLSRLSWGHVEFSDQVRKLCLPMKVDNVCWAAHRAMSPVDMVTYNDVNRPGILFVCDSCSLTESTIISELVPSGSDCENPLPNQDFDFVTVQLELVGFSYRINGQVFGETLFLRNSGGYLTLPSHPGVYPSIRRELWIWYRGYRRRETVGLYRQNPLTCLA